MMLAREDYRLCVLEQLSDITKSFKRTIGSNYEEVKIMATIKIKNPDGSWGFLQLTGAEISEITEQLADMVRSVNGVAPDANGNVTISASGGSGILTFETVEELQTAYPNGHNVPVWITSEKAWYYWEGTVTEPADTTAPVLTITSGGTFTGTKSVTMSTNETATIYYTLDGSTPTTSSSIYSSALSISATTTLKAFTVDTAGNQSAVQTVTYTFEEVDTTAPTVTPSPAAGTYTSAQSVTLSADETATIYYTLDGSTPTTSSNVYSAPISVDVTTTIQFIAVDSAGNQSTPVSATYTINIPVDETAPILTITPATTFTDSVTVTMSIDEEATIWYTLDDTDPSTSATRIQYTAPITLTETDAVKAYALDTAGNSSAVQTVTYTKSVPVEGAFVTDGLQIYYDFASLTETPATITDSSGNGNDGTLYGYAGTTESGINNGELIGDGTGDYIQIPHNSTFKSYPFTIEFYTRIKNREVTPIPTANRLFDMQYGNGTGNGINIFANNESHATPNKLIVAGSLGQPNYSVDLALYDNTYRHIAVTIGSASQKIYIDGVLVGSANQTSTALGTRDLHLFAAGNGLTDTMAHGCKFFRFYNKELSSAEVTQNYNDTVGV
jgi:hypothetical protein